MADDSAPNSTESNRRRRHSATIDLTATEVQPATAEPEATTSALNEGEVTPRVAQALPEETAVFSTETSPGIQGGTIEPEAGSDYLTAAQEAQEPAPAIAAVDEPATSSVDETSPPIPSSPDPLKPERRRGVFWPALGAGITGGAIAAALMTGLWLLGLVRLGNEDADLSMRLGLIEARLSTLGTPPAERPAGLDGLSSRVEKLESAAETRSGGSPDGALIARVAAAEAALKTVADGVVNLDRRAQAAANDLRTTRDRADAATKAVADLEKAGRPGGVERADLDAVATKVTALEASAKALQDEAARRAAIPPSDRAARVAVLAAALRGSVERGDAFAAELVVLKSLLPDASSLAPLEPFATIGVPSAIVLSREASAIAESMLRENRVASTDGSFLAKLQANAERLIRIRPVEAGGDDVLSVVARAESRSAQNDVPGTLAEFAKLPEDKRIPAESWMKRAQSRVSAINAARKIAADSASALAAQGPR